MSFTLLKKRLFRIYPLYLLFACIYMALMFCTGIKFTVKEILGNIFLVGSIAGMHNQYNWFFGGIFIFYLLLPYFVEFVSKNISYKQRIFGMFLILVLLSTCFINNASGIVVFTRLPIGFLGVVFAAIGENGNFNKKSIINILSISIIGFALIYICYIQFESEVLWNYGLYWYPFIFIVPGLCYFISLVAERFRGFNFLLEYIGNCSLEICLTHLVICTFIQRLSLHFSLVMNNVLKFQTMAIIVSIVIGVFVKKMESKCKLYH